MYCTCHFVPKDVLKRYADDPSLPMDQRNIFSNTIKIDTEMRRLRTQAGKLTRVASLMIPALALAPVAAAPAITVYDCNHGQTLPGAQIASPATSADLTVKHVFGETSSLASFYSQVFGRNSVDNAGMTILSSIHYGANYNNAFWNGSQMTYGDGDGSIFVDFSRGNDVIGHELTHGVTQHSLQLNYINESGGLNESLSDCFGSMFRQWEAKQNVNQADWLIGKDIMGPAALKKGFTCLRDMANPAASHCLAPQPTQYSQFKSGMDPHLSSGIPNLAFCTIAKAVGGNSWEKVGQIWYKSMTGFGPRPTMKMKAFANRTRAVAAQLFLATLLLLTQWMPDGRRSGCRDPARANANEKQGTMGTLKIERLRGGFTGLPGPNIESSGEQTMSALSAADQASVEALFKKPSRAQSSSAAGNIPHYKITQSDSGRSIEVPETAVPSALLACVKDKLR